MEIRIALAAETMLYLPIYCLERVYGPSGLKFHFETGPTGSQLGDNGAYRMLQNGDAAFCVCDPMVLLDEYRNEEGHQTIGVLVGSIATKTGLWGLVPEPYFKEYQHGDRFVEFLQNRQAHISNLLTYETASTASRVVDYLRRRAILKIDNVKPCPFGHELKHLRTPLTDDITPDLIVTCDLCAALAAEKYIRGARIALDLPKQNDRLGPTLFTGLIVHRGYLANNGPVVIQILKALQDVMDLFYNNDQVRLSMARMLAASQRSGMFDSLQHVDAKDDRIQFCVQAVERLCKDAIVAKKVKLEPSHWNKQAEIWYFDKDGSDRSKNDPYNFSPCSDLSLGRKACPGPFVKQFRRLRRFIVPVILPVALLVEIFDSVASWYHLHEWRGPDSRFWLIILAIALGTFLLMWLFDLVDESKHR